MTTAFVGNLSEKVPDNVIRQLLMVCLLDGDRVTDCFGRVQLFLLYRVCLEGTARVERPTDKLNDKTDTDSFERCRL